MKSCQMIALLITMSVKHILLIDATAPDAQHVESSFLASSISIILDWSHEHK